MPRMRRAIAPMMYIAKFGTSSTMKRKVRASMTETSQSCFTRAVEERNAPSTIDMKPIASFSPQVSTNAAPREDSHGETVTW
jgi:hypothetical protein